MTNCLAKNCAFDGKIAVSKLKPENNESQGHFRCKINIINML